MIGGYQTALMGVIAGGKRADPDTSIVLLMSFDGANGSTTFTDRSSYNHTITRTASAEISTTQSKFGGSSGYFPISGGRVTAPTAFSFTGDFCIEMFVWLEASSSSRGIFSLFDFAPRFYITYNYPSSPGQIVVTTFNGTLLKATASSGTWYHIAVTRASGTIRLFLDGVLQASTSDATSKGSTNLNIGNAQVGGLPYYMGGYIDELRITSGNARYTSDFTPPTAAFPNP